MGELDLLGMHFKAIAEKTLSSSLNQKELMTYGGKKCTTASLSKIM